MRVAPLHPHEEARLALLRAQELLDTEPERVFDNITELANLIFQTPIALVSLIDEHRQWFKSAHGLSVTETHRDYAFCAHAILGSEPLVVEDALEDERFFDNPLVAGEPRIRFYAGCPLVTASGLPLGTLCAIDHVPRKLTVGQKRALTILADQVVAHLEVRRAVALLRTAGGTFIGRNPSDRWLALMAHDLRAPFTSIIGLTELLAEDFAALSRNELQKCIAELNRAAHSGHQLLENLLDASLLNSGARTPQLATVHLATMLHRVRSIIEGTALNKGVQLTLECSESIVITADSRMMMSIVQNLASNAVKFTPSGGQVGIACTFDAGCAYVAIRDSGVGIAPAIVERFNAGDAIGPSKGTAGELGSGFGLQLVREFCQLCNASLSFSSTPNVGTCCAITFPNARIVASID